jgi:hypothetical protein
MKHVSRKGALRKVGLSSAIAVTVLASGIGVASASTPPSKPVSPPAALGSKDDGATPPAPMPPRGSPGIGGDVTSLSSSSITVSTLSGSSTYSIDASTTVTDLRPGSKSESLALGENVRVVPSSSDSSVAASIMIVPASLGGRVSAINADTITVAGPNGDAATIQVNADTTFTKSGANASINDVHVGTFIFATGTFGPSPTTVVAATVGIGTPGAPHAGPGNAPPPGSGPGGGPLAGPFASGLPDAPAPNAKARGVARS